MAVLLSLGLFREIVVFECRDVPVLLVLRDEIVGVGFGIADLVHTLSGAQPDEETKISSVLRSWLVKQHLSY